MVLDPGFVKDLPWTVDDLRLKSVNVVLEIV